MSNPEKDLERIEMQMASERFDWFAFRCEAAKELFVEGLSVMRGSDRDIARESIRQADILIEELKKIQ